MITSVNILDEEEVKEIIRRELLYTSNTTEEAFSMFLYVRYGITLEQFDTIIKTALPEKFI